MNTRVAMVSACCLAACGGSARAGAELRSGPTATSEVVDLRFSPGGANLAAYCGSVFDSAPAFQVFALPPAQ